MEDRKQAPLKPDGKGAWRKRNDAGPHVAVFPSGAVLKFRIPDQGALLRAGRLSQRLRDTALLCAAHPEGAEGYMRDLVVTATVAAEREEKITQAIEDGIALGHELVAEMLVEPSVTPEEVEAGQFPELDVRMLLEFAERRRNVDAAGNELPIIVLREWATFRHEPQGNGSSGDGGASGDEPGDDVPDADKGAV